VTRWQTAHFGSFDGGVVAVQRHCWYFVTETGELARLMEVIPVQNVKQEDDGCAIVRGSMCTAVTDVGELHNYLFCVGFVRLANSWKQGDDGVF